MKPGNTAFVNHDGKDLLRLEERRHESYPDNHVLSHHPILNRLNHGQYDMICSISGVSRILKKETDAGFRIVHADSEALQGPRYDLCRRSFSALACSQHPTLIKP